MPLRLGFLFATRRSFLKGGLWTYRQRALQVNGFGHTSLRMYGTRISQNSFRPVDGKGCEYESFTSILKTPRSKATGPPLA